MLIKVHWRGGRGGSWRMGGTRHKWPGEGGGCITRIIFVLLFCQGALWYGSRVTSCLATFPHCTKIWRLWSAWGRYQGFGQRTLFKVKLAACCNYPERGFAKSWWGGLNLVSGAHATNHRWKGRGISHRKFLRLRSSECCPCAPHNSNHPQYTSSGRSPKEGQPFLRIILRG